MDFIKRYGGFAASVLVILSGVADVLDVADKFSLYIKPIMVVSAVAVVIYGFYYFRQCKIFINSKNEKDEMQKNINLLESEICDGNKITENHVDVLFDVDRKVYIFKIRKKYTILTPSVKWFDVQFYCNNDLEDFIRSKGRYDDDPIKWDDLSISAELKYKNPEDAEFTPNEEVSILHVSDGNNYKQFHVQYITTDNDILDIKSMAEVDLTYSYTVPVKWWGSYLNRTISYFGEKTTVTISCKTKRKLMDAELKQYVLDIVTGQPKIIRKKISEIERRDNLYCVDMEFDAKRCAKYRLSWNADSVFGQSGLNTKNAVDAAQLTKY